jgi:hypothetical protein
MSTRILSIVRASAVVTGMIALSLATASAVTCTNTPISSDTTLGFDFETTGTCFVISNGSHLDLNGHTITCTAGSCGTAVQGGGGTRTRVSDGTIVGPFDYGVTDVHEAVGLKIEGATDTCISFANKIENNVLLNCGAGVRADMTENTYFVRENFISDAGFFGMVVNGRSSGSSGNGPQVERNYVRRSGVAGIFSFVSPSTELQVLDNIVTDDGASTPISLCIAQNPCADKIIDGNICSNATVCPTPDAPFMLP